MRNRPFIALVIFGISLFLGHIARAEGDAKPVPRTIIGLYDSKYVGAPRYSFVHKFLAMPLNHMGFKIAYHDVRAPLPELDDDVRGVAIWFTPDTVVDKAEPWVKWLEAVIEKKKKLLLIGELGLPDTFLKSAANKKRMNNLMHAIGIHDNYEWRTLVFDAFVQFKNPSMVEFERKFKGILEPFESTSVWTNGGGVSHLRIKTPQYETNPTSDLVVTSPNGGYIAGDYAVFEQLNDEGEVVLTAWYVNPFRFLRLVFDDLYLPKADTTTLNGNRIFYSHIDGDGWNNLSELEEHKGLRVLAAENLYEQIFKEYSDFPFTVGVIVSELRLDCYGLPKSRETAQNILRLPNVEAGSHTYSHPLFWEFFATDDVNEREKAFMDKYPDRLYSKFILNEAILGEKESPKPHEHYHEKLENQYTHALRGIHNPNQKLEEVFKTYETPRSYACESFNLDKEIRGSVDYINQLVPGKDVKLMQWSGNTTPFEAALRETRKLGIPNINGGDSRLDSEYPSYTSVSAIGVQVGDEWQIYSSNSNENTYTNLWTDRFFGFKFLRDTVENTESPLRVDPFNIYFHTYSGQKLPSLLVLKYNLDYARELELSRIFASEFANIATSFYDVEFIPIGVERWRVVNRNALQTIRFDNAMFKAVDFSRSVGVMGQNYHQGSLYVALDPEVDDPVMALKKFDKIAQYPKEDVPYIVQSNWQIKGLHRSKKSLIFSAKGLGELRLVAKMPHSGDYTVSVNNKEKLIDRSVHSTEDGLTRVNLLPGVQDWVIVEIRQVQ